MDLREKAYAYIKENQNLVSSLASVHSQLPLPAQRKLFVETLHAGNEGYYVCLPRKKHFKCEEDAYIVDEATGKKRSKNPWYNNNFMEIGSDEETLEKLVWADTNDSYVSGNPMDGEMNAKGMRYRNDEHCVGVSEMHLDIDVLHEMDPYDTELADQVISIVIAKLRAVFPEPTMIVLSGRGLTWIYRYDYMLDNPTTGDGNKTISENPEVVLHDCVYKLFVAKAQAMFDKDIIEVDARITDHARVLRHAGTMNTKAKRYALLYSCCQEKMYGPEELYALLGISVGDARMKEMEAEIQEPRKKGRPRKANGEGVDYTPKLAADILPFVPNRFRYPAKCWAAKIEKLVEYREQEGNGGMVDGSGRHQLIFLYYCIVRLFMVAAKAKERASLLNDRFTEPLTEAEFEMQIQRIDAHFENSGYHSHGVYIFRVETAAKFMRLAEEENGIIHFLDSVRKRQTCKANQAEARERDREIVSMWNLGMSYRQISEALKDTYQHVSVSTIKYVLRHYGVTAARDKSVEEIDFDGNPRYSRKNRKPCAVGAEMIDFGDEMFYEEADGTYGNPGTGGNAAEWNGMDGTEDDETSVDPYMYQYDMETVNDGFYSPVCPMGNTEDASDEEEAPQTKPGSAGKSDHPASGGGLTFHQRKKKKNEKRSNILPVSREGDTADPDAGTEDERSSSMEKVIPLRVLNLNAEQMDAVYKMKAGNCYVAGLGGSGKSTVSDVFLQQVGREHVLVLGPTAQAAKAVGGQTIHKGLSVPSVTLDPDHPIWKHQTAALEDIDYILIDEIGMVRFDLFAYVCRIKVEAEQEYGKSIKLICMGDFGQLPPVMTKQDRAELTAKWGWDPGIWEGSLYAFSTAAWNELGFNQAEHVAVLTASMRHKDDPEYGEALKAVYMGRIDWALLNYLNSRYVSGSEYDSSTIHICGRRETVEKINQACLAQHAGEMKYLEAVAPKKYGPQDPSDYDGVPFKIPVHVGMPVITTANGDGFTKGTFGHIVKINKGSVRILAESGEEIRVGRKEYISNDGMDKCVRQVPIIPAYAVTFHRVQGMTLNSAIIHPECWEAGHLYVGLSRLRTLKGLILAAPIRANDIIVSPSAINQYKYVMSLAGKAA